jgi:hypothetical protein
LSHTLTLLEDGANSHAAWASAAQARNCGSASDEEIIAAMPPLVDGHGDRRISGVSVITLRVGRGGSCPRLPFCGSWAAVKLKYEAQLSICPEQPCPRMDGFKQGSRVGYRVLNWPCGQSDFVPVEFLPNCHPAHKGKCDALALSFFNGPENARARFVDLLSRGADAKARMGGDQIGAVAIDPDDGIHCRPNKRSGHFSLHESVGASFHEKTALWGAVLEEDGARNGNPHAS